MPGAACLTPADRFGVAGVGVIVRELQSHSDNDLEHTSVEASNHAADQLRAEGLLTMSKDQCRRYLGADKLSLAA